MELRPYQVRGIQGVYASEADGFRRPVLVSPTGGGKTVMMGTMIRDTVNAGKKALVYVNKRMLTLQTDDALTDMGIEFGVRAAGYGEDHGAFVQIASMQTEHARQKSGKWDLYDADRVFVDEAHIQMGKTNLAILQKHYDAGATVVGVTATPLDMGEFYDRIVEAGVQSELRACGAIVPAYHFACDEPDLKALKVKDAPDGEMLSEKQQRRAIMTPTIFGRVGEWYRKLNPDRKPTILFAPGVNESLWFAEKFTAAGFPAAHIDGDTVWMNGEFLPTSTTTQQIAARKAVADGSRDGTIKVVCNRYVLREGVNWPWIEHMILAFVCGSLQTYLQVGGRGLRACPGKTHLTVQDHGGAWWRHGSLNADRVWSLDYTDAVVSGMRADRMRAKKDKEPWRCPGCGMVNSFGQCPCGHKMPPLKSRPVVMADGELREMTGDIYKPRRTFTRPGGEQLWEKMFWRSRTKSGERTFRAAMALFAKENYFQWPDPNWKYMPVHEIDKYRLVSQVPMERLR